MRKSSFFHNCATFCFDFYWKYHNFERNKICASVKWTDFSVWEILAGNLNSGRIYLIKAVLVFSRWILWRVWRRWQVSKSHKICSWQWGVRVPRVWVPRVPHSRYRHWFARNIWSYWGSYPVSIQIIAPDSEKKVKKQTKTKNKQTILYIISDCQVNYQVPKTYEKIRISLRLIFHLSFGAVFVVLKYVKCITFYQLYSQQ